ncbi:Hypothetical predicted protein [Podarcis lilfordi]|uniref:Uncharacterized protein n=1 Tax=Podarcis lilfordi TaxID=74358 RepID=A0AA35PG76_9SAUR|nr:Hypothetical predicted protein [Podarcis lilfordi]
MGEIHTLCKIFIAQVFKSLICSNKHKTKIRSCCNPTGRVRQEPRLDFSTKPCQEKPHNASVILWIVTHFGIKTQEFNKQAVPLSSRKKQVLFQVPVVIISEI